MDGRWSIRRSTPDDVAAIAAAERECFSDPWSEAGVRETLQDETVLALIAEQDGRLAGYLLARTIAGEAEILNLAVRPSWRRRGLATALLEAALAHLTSRGALAAFLEVRESNEGAQRLYGGFGFRPVAVRRAYYQRPREDAFVLRRELGGVA